MSTRSRNWLKLESTRKQELAIGGFTAPGGSRTDLGVRFDKPAHEVVREEPSATAL